MKIALAQINTTVGDFEGNSAKILTAYQRGAAAGVDLVVAPELAVSGYPPRDLLLKRHFVSRGLDTLNELAAATARTGLLVGYVGRNEVRPGKEATNSVALLQHGRILATRTKSLLPTYDVFDEDRYFEPAPENRPVQFNGCSLGLT
ncbi:MAG: NAD+ synthase, partial [Candidatus Omnitrophica bacterium]|nr:NAD+ synthase [Candidatus Omnitrophota bacterium]